MPSSRRRATITREKPRPKGKEFDVVTYPDTCLLLGKETPFRFYSLFLRLPLKLVQAIEFVVALFLPRHVLMSNVTFQHVVYYPSSK